VGREERGERADAGGGRMKVRRESARVGGGGGKGGGGGGRGDGCGVGTVMRVVLECGGWI